jgi:hypothetical protein
MRPHQQILLDRHASEKLAPLRNLDQPPRKDPLGPERQKVMAVEFQPAGRRDDAGDGAQQRGLAGTVVADQRHDLARPDDRIDAEQHRRRAIAGAEVGDIQEGRLQRQLRLLPR